MTTYLLAELLADAPEPKEEDDFAASVRALLCDACGVLSSIRRIPGSSHGIDQAERYRIEETCQVCADNQAYAAAEDQKARQELVRELKTIRLLPRR